MPAEGTEGVPVVAAQGITGGSTNAREDPGYRRCQI